MPYIGGRIHMWKAPQGPWTFPVEVRDFYNINPGRDRDRLGHPGPRYLHENCKLHGKLADPRTHLTCRLHAPGCLAPAARARLSAPELLRGNQSGPSPGPGLGPVKDIDGTLQI